MSARRLEALYADDRRFDWAGRHNDAVNEYLAGIRNTERARNERAVLALADAIEALFATQWATDGYVEPNVTAPLMNAFHDLLNVDMGRLDGGTLSSWLTDLAERHDIVGVL